MGKLNLGFSMIYRLIAVLLCSLFLVGCATEKNIPLSDAFWQEKNNKVAVAIVKPEQPGITKAGSQGLLDYAINSAMTSKLDKHLSKTNLTWYYSLSDEFSKKMQKLQVNAKTIDMIAAEDAKKYPGLAAQNNSDKILVIRLLAVGAIRNYSGFIPLSDPKAYCVLKGELLDVNTKKIIWRHVAAVTLPVQGSWDQPPAYPNLTSKMHIAIETSRQEILDSFFSGQPIA